MGAGIDGIATIVPGLWCGSMSLDHLALLRRDLDEFIATIVQGRADAPIAGCPGWTLVDLGVHLGGVHRWVLGALATGAPPVPDPADAAPTSGPDDLAAWLRAGADRLLFELGALDPAAPTWHPFPVEPKVAGLWPRRQAQEASVHRWDAQHAVGLDATIDAEFAADGIDEYWRVMLPRMLSRENLGSPATRVAVQTTDTFERWVVEGGGEAPVVLDDGADAPVELHGPAQDILLRLWGRPARGLEVRGDSAVLDEWLALGGA
jgi:uncharacterized protein (TIGR03083 family)